MAVEWNGFGGKKTPTLRETNGSPLKIGLPNRKVVFQPSISRFHVNFFGVYFWKTPPIFQLPKKKEIQPNKKMVIKLMLAYFLGILEGAKKKTHRVLHPRKTNVHVP